MTWKVFRFCFNRYEYELILLKSVYIWTFSFMLWLQLFYLFAASESTFIKSQGSKNGQTWRANTWIIDLSIDVLTNYYPHISKTLPKSHERIVGGEDSLHFSFRINAYSCCLKQRMSYYLMPFGNSALFYFTVSTFY